MNLLSLPWIWIKKIAAPSDEITDTSRRGFLVTALTGAVAALVAPELFLPPKTIVTVPAMPYWSGYPNSRGDVTPLDRAYLRPLQEPLYDSGIMLDFPKDGAVRGFDITTFIMTLIVDMVKDRPVEYKKSKCGRSYLSLAEYEALPDCDPELA